MGQLVWFVNHDRKEYFCPICKWGEIIANKCIMEALLDYFRDFWNNCKLEIVMEYSLDEINLKKYKDVIKHFQYMEGI